MSAAAPGASGRWSAEMAAIVAADPFLQELAAIEALSLAPAECFARQVAAILANYTRATGASPDPALVVRLLDGGHRP